MADTCMITHFVNKALSMSIDSYAETGVSRLFPEKKHGFILNKCFQNAVMYIHHCFAVHDFSKTSCLKSTGPTVTNDVQKWDPSLIIIVPEYTLIPNETTPSDTMHGTVYQVWIQYVSFQEWMSNYIPYFI